MLICYMLVDVADCALNVVLKSCSDFCPEAHSSRIWAMSSAQMSSLATKFAAVEITIDEYRMLVGALSSFRPVQPRMPPPPPLQYNRR